MCPRDLLTLVTRYHGGWIVIPVFNETLRPAALAVGVANIRRKLGRTSRTAAVAKAARLGLL